MITIHIVYTENHEILGFKASGHAKYAEYGKDIVCAGVSALTTGLVNSTLELTNQGVVYEMSEDTGMLRMKYELPLQSDAKLLFDAFMLGLRNIEESYGNEYIRIIDVMKISNKNYQIITHQEV